MVAIVLTHILYNPHNNPVDEPLDYSHPQRNTSYIKVTHIGIPEMNHFTLSTTLVIPTYKNNVTLKTINLYCQQEGHFYNGVIFTSRIKVVEVLPQRSSSKV